MATSLDDLDLYNREPRWWRPRNEWHLGWADYELAWIKEGRRPPEHWDYHRAGTRWEHVTWFDYRECVVAGHPNTNIYLWISDRSGYRWANETCEDCGDRVGGAIGSRRLKALGKDRNTLPVANAGVVTHEICAKCGGDENVEYHHWAPRHLFDDADQWPGDYLCRVCHTRWHRITTPDMARTPKAKPVSYWLTRLAQDEAS